MTPHPSGPRPSRADEARVQWALLTRFMREAPAQPATNLWRAVELPELARALPATGRALDVGCGDGVLTGILRDLVGASWQLVGLDPDPAETALAARSGLYQAVHTTGADRVPEPDASFDLAFSNSVLEHIPDLPPCLAETARLLRPGGLFAATVPSPGLHECMGGPSGLQGGGDRAAYLRDVDRRVVHLNYWDEPRWREELGRAGLELQSATPYFTRRQVRRWEALSNWSGGLVYRLWGKTRRPIEIQRQLGIRRGLPGALGVLAPALASLAGGHLLGERPRPGEPAGCLLVLARRPGGRVA